MLIFGNNIPRKVSSGVISLDISDHPLIFCAIKAGVAKSSGSYRDINYRCYQHYNKIVFNRVLGDVDWSFLDSVSDINDTLNTWGKNFGKQQKNKLLLKADELNT